MVVIGTGLTEGWGQLGTAQLMSVSCQRSQIGDLKTRISVKFVAHLVIFL